MEGFVAHSVSLYGSPLFLSLMLLVHFFSDYTNLNTSRSFCGESSSVFREWRLPLRFTGPRWETAFK